MKKMALMCIGSLSIFWGSVQAKTSGNGLGYGIKGGVIFSSESLYPSNKLSFDVTGGMFIDWSFPAPVPIIANIVLGGDILYATGITQENTRRVWAHQLDLIPKIGFDFCVKKNKKYFWQRLFSETSYAPHSGRWFIPAISYAPHFVINLYPTSYEVLALRWLVLCFSWQLPYRMQLEASVGKDSNNIWQRQEDTWFFKVAFVYR